MTRARRLMELLQVLHRFRRPVTAQALADELGVSMRTIYRDLDTLKAQGAQIEGEAGIGYLLKPGFLLPPLMFTDDEIAAVVLGTRWVSERTDAPLARAAAAAIAKLRAVLPPAMRDQLDDGSLLIGPGPPPLAGESLLPVIRQAIRGERALVIGYRDESGADSERQIWPLALAYFEKVRVLVAWCVLRQAFRHFRIDRIARLDPLDTRYPTRRRVLLAAWRVEQGIDS